MWDFTTVMLLLLALDAIGAICATVWVCFSVDIIQKLDRLVTFMGCYVLAMGFNTIVVIALGLLNMTW